MSLTKSILRGSDIVGHTEFNVDRSKFMNASEALSCIRMQWYQKNMADKGEAQDWGFARRGQVIEEYIVKCMRAANIPVARAGEDQLSLADKKSKISATPDGVIEWSAIDVEGLEIKSIDPRTNRSKLPKKAHVIQLQIAMALLNVDLSQAVIEKGKLIYVDASNLHDILEFEVEADDGILARMAPRAKLLLSTKKAEKLEREGKLEKNGCRYCAFTKLCGVTKDVEYKKARGNRGSNLDKAVNTYVEQKTIMADAKQVQDAAKEIIKQELGKRKTASIVVGSHKVKLAKVSGRKTLDKKALTKALEDTDIQLSTFEKVGAESERLTITDA